MMPQTREEELAKHRAYNDTHRAEIREKARTNYAENRDQLREYRRLYRKNNQERMRERDKAWRLANQDKVREMSYKYRSSNLVKVKALGRKAKHKMLGYPEPTRPIPSACECCGKPPTKALDLDHCHVSNRFRGWLCNRCNRGLGFFGDSIDGLMNAVRYLQRASQQET
jgi:hypothetical protein